MSEDERIDLITAILKLEKFSLKDPGIWVEALKDNLTSDYSVCGMRFVASWASLMERKMAEGKQLTDIAEEASHEADIEGITGFMYGYAVSLLSQIWEHGEELRRWHNLDAQIRDEGERANESGGVINPALVTIEI